MSGGLPERQRQEALQRTLNEIRALPEAPAPAILPSLQDVLAVLDPARDGAYPDVLCQVQEWA